MNRNNENKTNETPSLNIKEAFDKLVSQLSVAQMRAHVTERSFNTDFDDIPDSMFGAYYVYHQIVHSEKGSHDTLMKAGEFVLGIFDGNERVWLEFEGLYILADGLSFICSGSISNVFHRAYERTSMLDMFRLFSNVPRRVN